MNKKYQIDWHFGFLFCMEFKEQNTREPCLFVETVRVDLPLFDEICHQETRGRDYFSGSKACAGSFD